MENSNTQSTVFNPEDFSIVQQRGFDELKVGEVFRAPSRTLTDAHASAFQTVSCDNHPIHYDKEYAKRYGHEAPVVHGLQVLAFTAPGATLLPHYFGNVFVSFLELSCSLNCENSAYVKLIRLLLKILFQNHYGFES